MSEEISRRSFVAGSAGAACALGLAGAFGTGAAQAWELPKSNDSAQSGSAQAGSAQTSSAQSASAQASSAASTSATSASAQSAAAASASAQASSAASGDAQDQSAVVETRPEKGTGSPRFTGCYRSGAAPIDPVDPPASWDKEADVVIVGSGMGGLTCANLLGAAGKKVILVEKDPWTGGASMHAHEIMCNHGGTKMQNEAGYYWPPELGAVYDPTNEEQTKRIALEYEKNYQFSIPQETMMREVSEGPKFIDWLDDQEGIELELKNFGGQTGSPLSTFNDAKVAQNGWSAVLGVKGVTDQLTTNGEGMGVEFVLGTECKALVKDGDTIVGIKVEDSDGELYIKGDTAVVLAAGGFGMNLDLLEKYCPTAYMNAAGGGPVPEHTGDAFRMGLGAGADYAGYDSWGNWDGGVDEYWGEGDGNYFHYMYRAPYIIGFMLPIFSIDKTGARIPHCKMNPALTDNVSSLIAFFAATSAAMSAAPGHRRYQVFDAKWDFHDLSSVLGGTIFEDVDVTSYTKNLRPGAEQYVPTDFDTEWATMLEDGAIKKADTIEELESLCGFASGVMQDAVDRWNADCDAGIDSEDMYPMPPECMVKVDTPPYYAICYGATIEPTGCGLRVNSKLQVLDRTDQHQAIPGLYATWQTAGGLFGECQAFQFGCITPMGSVAFAGTTGYIVANSLLGTYDEQ